MICTRSSSSCITCRAVPAWGGGAMELDPAQQPQISTVAEVNESCQHDVRVEHVEPRSLMRFRRTVMAQGTIRRAAAAQGSVPARCLCCGAPTDGFVMKKFTYHPPKGGFGTVLSVLGQLLGGDLPWPHSPEIARMRAPL